MPTTIVTFSNFEELEDAFMKVADSWRLSAWELEAIQGMAFPCGSDSRYRSRFVSDR